jgi:uncharacterized membrane protein
LRTAVLTVALAFIAFFAYLLLRELALHGIHNAGDLLLTAGSLLVLLLLGVGIVGALRNPPDE